MARIRRYIHHFGRGGNRLLLCAPRSSVLHFRKRVRCRRAKPFVSTWVKGRYIYCAQRSYWQYEESLSSVLSLYRGWGDFTSLASCRDFMAHTWTPSKGILVDFTSWPFVCQGRCTCKNKQVNMKPDPHSSLSSVGVSSPSGFTAYNQIGKHSE